jgi:energy-coupling factor transporter ATP-binding protein EcfA2
LKILGNVCAGADQEAHLAAAKELEAAAAEARKAEEAREQEAASKLVEAQKRDDALSPIEQEARDARDRKRELELANEALVQKAAARSRVKDALVALRQGRRAVVGSSTDEMADEGARDEKVIIVILSQRAAARERIQYEPGKWHVAVCGTSGSGKSSLINAFRGVRPRDASAARVGVMEMTLQVTRYPDPRSELPYSRFVWYDLPGAGTVAVSNGQYFETQELFAYNCNIIVYGERFTNIVDIIEKCLISGIPTFIVRSKADQLIGNMIQDETDSSPGDDGYDWMYQEFKSKYIDATKSDFDMHKEVMAEVLFEDYPSEQSKLLRQRVYMVSAANVRSLMQAGVEKGGGASKSKNIDEARLVEDVLRVAVDRFLVWRMPSFSKNIDEALLVEDEPRVAVDRFLVRRMPSF